MTETLYPPADACWPSDRGLQVLNKSVASSGEGNREALAASETPARYADIIAPPGNSGKVYIVDETGSAKITLDPGDSTAVRLPYPLLIDLSLTYIYVATGGDGVEVLYIGA